MKKIDVVRPISECFHFRRIYCSGERERERDGWWEKGCACEREPGGRERRNRSSGVWVARSNDKCMLINAIFSHFHFHFQNEQKPYNHLYNRIKVLIKYRARLAPLSPDFGSVIEWSGGRILISTIQMTRSFHVRSQFFRLFFFLRFSARRRAHDRNETKKLSDYKKKESSE